MLERLTKKSELNLCELHAALSRAKQAHTHTHTHICARRQNKKLQLILGYAVRGARKRQTLINPIISPLACLMCHAVNFPHSAKTTVRKNVVAPAPCHASVVNLMLLCVFCMHVSTDNCNNWRQQRLHKALQLTLLQLSRAATAVPAIGIGLISMDSATLHNSARPGELFILCVEFLGHTNWKYATMHAPHYVYAMWDRLTSAIIHNNNGSAPRLPVLLVKNNKQHWLHSIGRLYPPAPSLPPLCADLLSLFLQLFRVDFNARQAQVHLTFVS